MKSKRVLIMTTCVITAIIVGFGMSYLFSVHKYKEKVSAIIINDVNLSQVSDGQYTGACDTGLVSAKVLVSIKDHRIVDIKLIDHKNGRGKGGEAVIQRVIKAQSTQVDTVSGATNSSKVILKAINNAIENK